MAGDDVQEIAERLLDRQIAAGSRAIRWLDDRDPRGPAVLRDVHPHALGLEEDLFFANLLDVHGRAAERLGRDRQAARDYHRAQVINERLLEAALERAVSSEPPSERETR